MKKILIVEDDPSIRMGLEECFRAEHYDIASVDDGDQGFTVAKDNQHDLIILDLMLPGKNGFDICRELRSLDIKTPIIILTSKKEETDKVLGLEIGADDYITKPFSIRELQARVRALLRRASDNMNSELSEYSFGNIYINFKSHEVIKGKEQVKISSTELNILKYLIEHKDEVISRDKLLNEAWGYNTIPTTRTVDNYILSLRKIIEDNPAQPVHIITIHKAGYKFVS